MGHNASTHVHTQHIPWGFFNGPNKDPRINGINIVRTKRAASVFFPFLLFFRVCTTVDPDRTRWSVRMKNQGDFSGRLFFFLFEKTRFHEWGQFTNIRSYFSLSDRDVFWYFWTMIVEIQGCWAVRDLVFENGPPWRVFHSTSAFSIDMWPKFSLRGWSTDHTVWCHTYRVKGQVKWPSRRPQKSENITEKVESARV